MNKLFFLFKQNYIKIKQIYTLIKTMINSTKVSFDNQQGIQFINKYSDDKKLKKLIPGFNEQCDDMFSEFSQMYINVNNFR